MNPQPTAAILIIGDEILKGQTIDTNSGFATKLFHSLGVNVIKIVVIGDDIQVIAAEVRALASQASFVITSGGVGPTHDDLTYEGVAAAFGLAMEMNGAVADMLSIFHPGPRDVETNPAMKMAWLPSGSELLFVGKKKRTRRISEWTSTTFPVVKVNNVYVFPGLPSYFEASLLGVQYSLPSALGSTFCDAIYVAAEEVDLVEILNGTISQFGNRVAIGSYPVLDHPKYRTKLTLETTSAQLLNDVITFMKGRLSPHVIVDMEPADPMAAALQRLDSLPCCKKVQQTFQILGDMFNKYEPDQVAISFNGGKDCTALLHLVHLHLQSQSKGERLKALYIRCPDPFPQVETFITEAAERYSLEVLEYRADIKSALSTMLAEHPNVKAVLMGNRRADPHSEKLNTFQMTDSGWPEVMRVFPLLDWEFRDIWQVLLTLRVPYCTLYDQGYTSLGHRQNTWPNPALRYEDEKGDTCYRPAYTLADPAGERVGRGAATSSSGTS